MAPSSAATRVDVMRPPSPPPYHHCADQLHIAIGVEPESFPNLGSARGGVNITPQVFSRELKRYGMYVRPNFQYLVQHESHVFYKISDKLAKNVLRKWRFSNDMFRYFGSYNGKCLKGSRMHSFEIKRSPKTSKNVKLNVLRDDYIGFLYF